MADIFSREIHAFLSNNIQRCTENKAAAEQDNDADAKSFLDGQLHEFTFFRHYLADNFDLKNQKYF